MDEIKVYCRFDEMLDIEKCEPNPNNPNNHDTEQITRLAFVIENNGWRNPIVVSKRSGLVVKGHGRLMAGQRLGCKKVPVEYQEYSSEDAELADLIADNKIAELSQMDVEKLIDMVSSVENVQTTGFTEDELQQLIDGVNYLEDDNSIQTETQKPKVNTFIVEVQCLDPNEQTEVFNELVSKGLRCRMI